MSDIEAFRKALNEAGQPWSRMGVRVAGAGVVALLALQIALMAGVGVPYAFHGLLLAVSVIAAGWGLLIAAMLKRRRWARANPIERVALDVGRPGEAP